MELIKLAAAAILVKTAQKPSPAPVRPTQTVQNVMNQVFSHGKYIPNIDSINPSSLDSLRSIFSGTLSPRALNYTYSPDTNPRILRNAIALRDSIATRDYPRETLPPFNSPMANERGVRNPLEFAAMNLNSGLNFRRTNEHPVGSYFPFDGDETARIGIGTNAPSRYGLGDMKHAPYTDFTFAPITTGNQLGDLLNKLWVHDNILNHELREGAESDVPGPRGSHRNISLPIQDIYNFNSAPEPMQQALTNVRNYRQRRYGNDWNYISDYLRHIQENGLIDQNTNKLWGLTEPTTTQDIVNLMMGAMNGETNVNDKPPYTRGIYNVTNSLLSNPSMRDLNALQRIFDSYRSMEEE